MPSQTKLQWLSRLLPNSLAQRAIALSTIWAAISLVIIAGFITSLYRDAAEKNFSSLLSAHLFNLIAATSIDREGRLQGSPELGDLRYYAPNSGWYWTIDPVSKDVSGALKSSSMAAGNVNSADTSDVPFDGFFRRRYQTAGLDGEVVEVYETEVAMDGNEKIARFRVMGNRNEFESEISEFSWALLRYLVIFGIGSIAVNALAILAGLHPLKKVTQALSQIREGKAQHLDGAFPNEIEPLANEMNALISNNRRIVERSRTQVGNLAHSLKTPLSVVINEGQSMGGKQGKLISEQATAMQTQIQHYLQRARLASQRESVVFRAPVQPVIERLLRVMRKLTPNLEFAQTGETKGLVFAGETEDLEEILGNLLENASKWGNSRVEVKALQV
ncbi:MAG: histidine kinase, partial [Rhizobiaceae bacterium]